MLGERCTSKKPIPVSLLSMGSKFFEKLVHNRLVHHIEKCCFFSNFQYSFRSSQSTSDLLTVASDKIARAFDRSGDTLAVALDKSNDFYSLWHVGLLYKLNSYGISSQIFGLIPFFLNKRRLWVISDGKRISS